jgi:glyoxylase-like metal-dependent hydrolase (beta-lactamase superfamily II)
LFKVAYQVNNRIKNTTGNEMKVDNLDLYLLNDGSFKVDGGALFGQTPKDHWGKLVKIDTRNRITLGLNIVLIKNGNKNILIDSGVGNKFTDVMMDQYAIKGNRVQRALKKLGLTGMDIDIVILTHLHFAHAGGLTKSNRNGALIPTFPNAKHIIQEDAWQHAMNPNERNSALFFKNDLQLLSDLGLVELIKGDHEVFQGINILKTDGPSQGHQIVEVGNRARKVVFLGDLVPTKWHLNLNWISSLDQEPEITLGCKRRLLLQAEKEGWLILFSHGYPSRAGTLIRQGGRIILQPETIDSE